MSKIKWLDGIKSLGVLQGFAINELYKRYRYNRVGLLVENDDLIYVIDCRKRRAYYKEIGTGLELLRTENI